jgi:trimeric autotransporter adhesin
MPVLTSNLFQYAQLADASYAILGNEVTNVSITNPGLVSAALQSTRSFSLTQATDFVANWSVLNHQVDTDWDIAGSGFSATLFRSTKEPFEVVLAIRGTAGLNDTLDADINGLVTNGLAYNQIIDLYNYVQRLKGAVGADVQQTRLVLADLDTPFSETLLVGVGIYALRYKIEHYTASGVGLGFANEVNNLSTVVGHSLGGHLAFAFTRLFAGDGLHAVNAVTVNGAGFPTGIFPGVGGWASHNIEMLFTALQGSTTFDSNHIFNMYADANPEIVTQDWLIGLQQQGTHSAVYIEDPSILGGAIGHGATGVTDSMAVYDIFFRLDPSLSGMDGSVALAALKPIFDAGSNDDRWDDLIPFKQPNRALENIVGVLSEIFGLPAYIPTDDRESLYLHIHDLINSSRFMLLEGTFDVISLVGMSSSDMVSAARNDIGVLYALVNLNHFALTGNTAFYDGLNANGTYNLDKYSSEFLADRGEMLRYRILYDTGATDSNQLFTLRDRFYDTEWDTNSPGNFDYVSLGNNGENFRLVVDGSGSGNTQVIMFDDGTQNELIGGTGDDRLYGMGGDDRLVGGAGNDRLEGGEGVDQYVAGDGRDIIRDSDGQGRIVWSGADGFVVRGRDGVGDTANNWERINDTTYFDRQNTVTYTLISNFDGTTTLAITSPTRTYGTGGIRIENFHEGDLGIHLNGSVQAPVLSPLTAGADVYGTTDIDFNATPTVRVVANGLAGNDWLSGGWGNDRLDGGAGDDYLMGSRGADTLIGGSGNDFIVDDQRLNFRRVPLSPTQYSQWYQTNVAGVEGIAMFGDGWLIRRLADGSYQLPLDNVGYIPTDLNDPVDSDIVLAGAGDDHVWTSEGNDFIDGGDGNDYLSGGGDHDTITGGAGNDQIFGDLGGRSFIPFTGSTIAGNDVLTGGTGDDIIAGNGGNDIIDGGDDNDQLLGDNELEIINGLSLADQVTGEDVIDGGAGNDFIQGGGGNDTIDGGIGNDVIYGDNAFLGHFNDYRSYDGNDMIHGGEGNDVAAGMGGNDTIYGDAGNDIIWGDHESISAQNGGDDRLYGGAGDDTINGNGGNDFIDGGADNDQLQGNEGNDDIGGGAGNDSLQGNDGNDTLTGGTGNDVLRGDAGDDIYVFASGWGHDSIQGLGDSDSGQDTIRFGAGIDPATIIVSVVQNGSLLLQTPNGLDTLILEGYFNSSGSHRIEFANGTVWTSQTIANRFTPNSSGYSGTVANDVIVASSMAATLYGGLGNDTLVGGSGNDILYGGDAPISGVLSVASDNDLLIGGRGNDQLYGYRGSDRLEGGAGDDLLLGGEGIDTLLGGDGNDDLRAGELTYIDGIFFDEGSTDYLDGGRGNDTLSGGLGQNTYRFGANFGHDTLYLTQASEFLSSTSSERAILEFIDGISASNISFALVNGDLVISYAQNTITVVAYNARGTANIADVRFSDGSQLSAAQWEILNQRLGTAGNDVLYGTSADETFIGGAGNDRMGGAGGSDRYIYNLSDGDDHIGDTGTSGFDRLILGAGLNPDAVTLYHSGLTYYLTINATGNYIEIGTQSNVACIEEIVFGNGVVWNAAAIASNAVNATLQLDFFATTAGETLTGNQYANEFRGGFYNYTFIGGNGDDSYWVGDGQNEFSGSALVVENAGSGTDSVYARTYSYTLPVNVENLYGLTTSIAITASLDSYTRVNAYRARSFIGNDLNNVIDVSAVTVGNYIPVAIRIDGGLGADTLIGSSLNDTYVVDNIGDAVIENDSRVTGQSIDTVESSISYSIANMALVENISLVGTTNISAYGNAGDNRLDGSMSSGANVLTGGQGNDTYVIANGDTIVELANAGSDTVVFNNGIVGNYNLSAFSSVENISLGRTVGNSNITGDSGDNVLTGNAYDNTIDGGAGNDTIYDTDAIQNLASDTDILIGGAGDDIIISRHGYDTVRGGTGNDTITLSNVANAYDYSAGDGSDTLQDAGGIDTLRFDASVSITDVRFLRDLTSLIIQVGSSAANSIRVLNYWDNADAVLAPIENIAFADGTTWNTTEVLTRLAGLYVTGSATDDILFGGAGFDTLLGNAGSDTLQGGAGDDLLDGGLGNDIYQFDVGFGHDRILALNNNANGVDSIRFASGITVASIVIATNTNGDAILTVSGTSDQLTLSGYLSVGAPAHEIRFADGTVWHAADVLQRLLTGTSGADTIIGFASDDAINALGGDDYVDGQGGNDTIHGNDGNDQLNGSAGNDTLYGDAGNDSLYGGVGSDILVGGTGDDTYSVLDQADTIIENLNEGTDTVYANSSYVLGNNLENLTLSIYDINGVPTGLNTNATGNALNNTLNGNIYDNILDGGLGADTLIGGAGNDTYIVDNAGDVVTENASAGTDTVQASITYTLGSNVENLTLTGNSAINATGNALNNVLIGNSSDNTLNGGTGNDTMSGGVGNDTYIVDAIGDVVTENSNEGVDLVQSGVTYTLSNNLENLTLTGTAAINGTGNALDNVLTGNSANNTLTGGAGNDTLNGGAGTDTMVGGTGNDTYVVDATTDVVTEAVNEGTDLVQSSVTYTIGNNIENLTLTSTAAINGTGNTLDNILTGNSANNTLNGGDGNDTLNGGNGTDTLVGGLGNDIYIVDTTTDVITENAASGTDTVQSSVSFSLAATAFNNVENLTLTGTATIGTGNTLNNVLTGNVGNNTLSGGIGNDTMIGGAGDDTYVVDATADVITELLNEGTDLVQSSVTYTLANNIENITLTGTIAINATGNALDNVLTGNSANNTLNGGDGNDTLNGGSGTDTLVGGIGNDIYIVDTTTDVITENAASGIDTVQSSVNFSLVVAAFNNVENLTLTGTATTATGNALDNVLVGNSSNNTLTGNAGNDTLDGGVGSDTMLGGVGNDIYVVDVASDVVTELASEGTDTVQSAITYTLGANVENLSLTGTAVINGTGNTLNNVITGNSANNTLNGGAGNDTLNGGQGADILIGGTGVNQLYGNEGNDILSSDAAATGGSGYEGGTGNDTITGGQQNDTYRFNIGDGQDTITDVGLAGFTDIISFGAGITSSMLAYTRVGNNLLISVNGSADTITVNSWYSNTLNQIEQISFANGTSLNASQLQTLTSGLTLRAASTTATQDLSNMAALSTPSMEENYMTRLLNEHRFSNQSLLDQIQTLNDLVHQGRIDNGGLGHGSVVAPVSTANHANASSLMEARMLQRLERQAIGGFGANRHRFQEQELGLLIESMSQFGGQNTAVESNIKPVNGDHIQPIVIVAPGI